MSTRTREQKDRANARKRMLWAQDPEMRAASVARHRRNKAARRQAEINNVTPIPSMTWMDEGNCHGRTDLEFFPRRPLLKDGFPDSSMDERPVPEAIVECCKTCPVYIDCFAHSVAHEEYGIWAGMNEVNRRLVSLQLHPKAMRNRQMAAASRRYRDKRQQEATDGQDARRAGKGTSPEVGPRTG